MAAADILAYIVEALDADGVMTVGLGTADTKSAPALFHTPWSIDYVRLVTKANRSSADNRALVELIACLTAQPIQYGNSPPLSTEKENLLRACWGATLLYGWLAVHVREDADQATGRVTHVYSDGPETREITTLSPVDISTCTWMAEDSLKIGAALIIIAKMTWFSSGHHLGSLMADKTYSGFSAHAAPRLAAAFHSAFDSKTFNDDGFRALIHGCVHPADTRTVIFSVYGHTNHRFVIKSPLFSATTGAPRFVGMKLALNAHISKRLDSGGAGTRGYVIAAQCLEFMVKSRVFFCLSQEVQKAALTVLAIVPLIKASPFSHGDHAKFLTGKDSLHLPEAELDIIGPFCCEYVKIFHSHGTLMRSGLVSKYSGSTIDPGVSALYRRISRKVTATTVTVEDYHKFLAETTATAVLSGDVASSLRGLGLLTPTEENAILASEVYRVIPADDGVQGPDDDGAGQNQQ